jgi:type I restriction enzyme, S subunit
MTGTMKNPIVNLGDVVTFEGGGTPSKANAAYWGGDIPWASVKDVSGPELSSTVDYITEEGLANSASRIVPAGNVILPTRMALGRAAINTVDVAINQDLRVAYPNPDLARRYLLWFIISNARLIESLGSGATVKGITLDKLRDLQIPLPPLAEQKRIAAILDKADAIRSKLQQFIRLSDDFLRSVFLDMFGDPVTNPKGWELHTLTSVIGDSFRNGLSPSTSGTVSGKVLTLSSITSGTFATQFLREAIFDRAPSENQQVTRNTFLICRGNGNKSMVGIGVFPPCDMPSVSFPDTMIACTIDRAKIEPEYLQAMWSSAKVRTQIDAGARTTNGTYKVNQTLLGSIEFPIPPLEIQKRFSAISQATRSQSATIKRLAEESETLFSSLQQRAFRGEL